MNAQMNESAKSNNSNDSAQLLGGTFVPEESTFSVADVSSFLPLVRSIARQIHQTLPPQAEIEDLIQAGALGLMDAYQRYDSSKRAQFSTFAYLRIRGAMLDSLRGLDWCPRQLRQKSREWHQSSRVLANQLGRTPLDEELATGMKMSLADYHELRRELESAVLYSLDQVLDGRANCATISGEQEIADSRRLTADQNMIEQQRAQAVARSIEQLSERQRVVITLYYFEELTMKEIASVLGIAESRVSQLHSAALGKLKSALMGC